MHLTVDSVADIEERRSQSKSFAQLIRTNESPNESHRKAKKKSLAEVSTKSQFDQLNMRTEWKHIEIFESETPTSLKKYLIVVGV